MLVHVLQRENGFQIIFYKEESASNLEQKLFQKSEPWLISELLGAVGTQWSSQDEVQFLILETNALRTLDMLTWDNREELWVVGDSEEFIQQRGVGCWLVDLFCWLVFYLVSGVCEPGVMLWPPEQVL